MTPRQAAEPAQSRNGVSQGQRPVLSRFAAARTAVACRELVGGSSCRQLSQAVVDISRVPRLTAIGLPEMGTILQKIVRGHSHKRASKPDNKPVMSQRDISKVFDISDVSDKE